jgi:hypothetical protein
MKNQNVQTEVDAWFLYKTLAEHEEDEAIANVLHSGQRHSLLLARYSDMTMCWEY